MAGIVFLILRFLLALSLYAFLGWALFTLWRDLKTQGELLASRKSPAIELTIIEGDQEQIRLFKVQEITIGRDPACECVVASGKVSAKHARLSYHHNQWWFEDLGSTNGSYLNETAIDVPIVVANGDHLRCADVDLTIHLDS
jgi:pSer/pThr/pTyr-binding forkhead associated (FHA) protein